MTKKVSKVGDTVSFSSRGSDANGLTGKVVHKDRFGDCVVEFEGFTEGHDGHLHDAAVNRWWCNPRELTKVAAPKKPTQEYRGNGKHYWEIVTASPPVDRLRVPGGWLYKTNNRSSVFVPMPAVVKHKV